MVPRGRRVQPLLDGSVIVVVDERRNLLRELVSRLDKRKMADAVERAQRGIWNVLCEPLHVRTIWIAAPDDEQGRHVEPRDLSPKIVPRQLAREGRSVRICRELQRLEQRPVLVLSDEEPSPDAAKMVAKVGIR